MPGLVLAVVGELLCAFSPSIELLIWGGRLMVGLGASLIIPSVLGMVSMLYEGEERKQAYGVIAASAALATIIPIALGILVDIAGFRVTFGVLAAYFVALLVASAKLPTGGGLHAGKFDAPGCGYCLSGIVRRYVRSFAHLDLGRICSLTAGSLHDRRYFSRFAYCRRRPAIAGDADSGRALDGAHPRHSDFAVELCAQSHRSRRRHRHWLCRFSTWALRVWSALRTISL